MSPAPARSSNIDWPRRLGASCLALTGLGHLATQAFSPNTPEREAMIRVMQGMKIEMPGAVRSLWDFYLGFSVSMGVLLIGCGVLLFSPRQGRGNDVVAFALALALAAGAWHWLFAVPAVLTSAAAGCFAVMLVRRAA
jgi:hypothetical protein